MKEADAARSKTQSIESQFVSKKRRKHISPASKTPRIIECKSKSHNLSLVYRFSLVFVFDFFYFQVERCGSLMGFVP